VLVAEENLRGLTRDYNRLHTDEEFAQSRSIFGRRVAYGPLGLSLGMGLFQRLEHMVNLHRKRRRR